MINLLCIEDGINLTRPELPPVYKNNMYTAYDEQTFYDENHKPLGIGYVLVESGHKWAYHKRLFVELPDLDFDDDEVLEEIELENK